MLHECYLNPNSNKYLWFISARNAEYQFEDEFGKRIILQEDQLIPLIRIF